MTTSISNIQSVCDRIHTLVQTSGLHFMINQTPWSSYITIRRKFINPGAYKSTGTDVNEQLEISEQLKALKERNNQLEKKLADVEVELVEREEESIKTKKEYEKTVHHLNAKIYTLENKVEATKCHLKNKQSELLILEKEKKVKDEIIQNINAHFNQKVSDLKTDVEELEAFKKQTIKAEKKASKKLRQKQKSLNVKEDIKNTFEHELVIDSDKDVNENLHFESASRSDIKSNESAPMSPPPRGCSPARRSPHPHASPLRRCSSASRSPVTPPSPHTPSGSPPPIAEQKRDPSPSPSLSYYFLDAASEGSEKPDETFITAEYIKNRSKYSLVPRQRRNDSSS